MDETLDLEGYKDCGSDLDPLVMFNLPPVLTIPALLVSLYSMQFSDESDYLDYYQGRKCRSRS